MSRRRGLVSIGAALLACTTVACVSTQEVGGSNNPSPTTTSIVTKSGALGNDVSAGGVMATVVDILPFDQSPSGVPRIQLVMRSENLTDHEVDNPDLDLRCDESPKNGDWYRGSTWEPNQLLPVNRVAQGEVVVGFPLRAKSSDYPVVTCTNPRVRLTLRGVRDEPPVAYDYPVPAEVIAEALRRPRGTTLPVAAESK